MDEEQIVLKIRNTIWQIAQCPLLRGVRHEVCYAAMSRKASCVKFMTEELLRRRGSLIPVYVVATGQTVDVLAVAIVLSTCQSILGAGHPDDDVLIAVHEDMCWLASVSIVSRVPVFGSVQSAPN
jgi:hypothetical protein